MSSGKRKTREDLIQVEYDLYTDMLIERRAKQEEDPQTIALRLLDLRSAENLISFDETLTPSDIESVLLVVADLLDRAVEETVRGANPTRPTTWETIELGDGSVRVPTSVSLLLHIGENLDVPIWFRTWSSSPGYAQYLHVYARASDADEVEGFLPDLIATARSEMSPYLRRVVEAQLVHGSLKLRVVPTPLETRSGLIFEDDVWSAVTRNVDRLFERMDALVQSGLGGNRGLLLAGPPGTGKTALCRVLAREYEGRATVVIVSASVGSYMLSELYERLNLLTPALVLVEDLDLIVGDRQDGVGPGLIQFLTVLDGLMTRHTGVVTVATTNDPRAVDAAAQRAARFDQMVHLGLPSEEARRAILELYLMKVDHVADLAGLASQSDGLSGADLREVVRSAILDADDGTVRQKDLAAASDRLMQAKETV